MLEETYRYVIVGGGLTAASAIGEIRELDKEAPILLIGGENHLPYNRPPLSKKLWFGDKKVEDIFVFDQEFYDSNNVQLRLGTRVVKLDARNKNVTDNTGASVLYEKLLLATGGEPRHLSIPGSDLEGIYYYRYLDDYQRLRQQAVQGKSAVVIGGGFIGSEMAAALTMNGIRVTMIFPEPYLVQRVFPEGLGRAIQGRYQERGITVADGDKPVAFSRRGTQFQVQTENGRSYESDLLVVGIGITPSVELARGAGLEVANGILVNEYLQTSHPDIYAAGDNASFPYLALGERMRIEHWNNAQTAGEWAGHNMAGGNEPFDKMPYFYSDLFEFGYEAVGEVESQLATYADWEKENETGVIYYLRDGKVRGVMLCNVWGKLDAARKLIRSGEQHTPESLRGTITR